MNSGASFTTVLGAGSWGTALALQLSRKNACVRLWGNIPEEMRQMQAAHANTQYLPDIPFPKNLEIYEDFAAALKESGDILIAVPSFAFRDVMIAIKPYLTEKTRIISATKGLDPKTNAVLHEVAEEELGKHVPFAALSGPTFAKEVAKGLPTAITAATKDVAFAKDVVALFHGLNFRVYTSTDVIGVQVGGAVKNVLAIAVGISDGLGYGANARAALITRGLVEITRLGIALGGQPETFVGLAGMGDLVLTSTDNQSRNRRFGLALGQGANAKEAEENIHQVVEGAHNARQAYFLAQKLNVSMPITEQVYRVLHEKLPPDAAVQALLMRAPKPE